MKYVDVVRTKTSALVRIKQPGAQASINFVDATLPESREIALEIIEVLAEESRRESKTEEGIQTAQAAGDTNNTPTPN